MFKLGKEDIKSEFPGSGGESLSTRSLEREERVGKENGVEVNLRQEDRVWNSIFTHNRNRLLPVAYHWGSLLPLQWRITHSSQWKAQVLASGSA